jgi:hypothetical protein
MAVRGVWAAMKIFRYLVWTVIALLGAGCASTQLNYNTADLANSLNSLAKRQIFFNLAQALNDPEFVPSQVTISIGTAQTANAITPSIGLPLGPPIATTSRFTAGANPSAQFSTQVTAASPTLGVQATDAWNQSWTMVPAASSNQLRRLRTLYQYATGTLQHAGMTGDLSLEEAERQFLCEYSMQAMAVSPGPGGNLIYRLEGCRDNNSRTPHTRVVHVDPTFTQGPNCVVCIDDLNAKSLQPYVNPNLKYHFVRTRAEKTEGMVKVGSYDATEFYVCGAIATDCPRVPSQDAFDGRKAFSDFILFVYEAMSISAGGGPGAARSTGGSFVYSVR